MVSFLLLPTREGLAIFNIYQLDISRPSRIGPVLLYSSLKLKDKVAAKKQTGGKNDEKQIWFCGRAGKMVP